MSTGSIAPEGNEQMQDAWSVSWIDRAQTILSRVRPWWMPLFVFPIALVALEVTLLWRAEGESLTQPTSSALMVLYATLPFYVFGFLFFVDQRGADAMERLRPLLKHDNSVEPLRFTISNMPFWPALVSSLAGIVFFALLRSLADLTGEVILTGTTQMTRWIRISEGLMLWILLGVTFYHTVRQLRIINYTYSHGVRVDLLDQAPLYGLARIPAYTAIGLAIPVSLVLLALPDIPTDPLSLGLLIVLFGISTITLIAPIYRVHLELEEEKANRQSVNANLIESLILRHHSNVRSFTLQDSGDIQTSLDVLNTEREIIGTTTTWPWPAGSIRAVFAALLLPIVIWIIQQVLRSLFP